MRMRARTRTCTHTHTHTHSLPLTHTARTKKLVTEYCIFYTTCLYLTLYGFASEPGFLLIPFPWQSSYPCPLSKQGSWPLLPAFQLVKKISKPFSAKTILRGTQLSKYPIFSLFFFIPPPPSVLDLNEPWWCAWNEVFNCLVVLVNGPSGSTGSWTGRPVNIISKQ